MTSDIDIFKAALEFAHMRVHARTLMYADEGGSDLVEIYQGFAFLLDTWEQDRTLGIPNAVIVENPFDDD